MPPSDDIQELIAESSSSTSSATIMSSATAITTTTVAHALTDATRITCSTSNARTMSCPALNTNLQDELSNVFESKMIVNNTQKDKETLIYTEDNNDNMASTTNVVYDTINSSQEQSISTTTIQTLPVDFNGDQTSAVNVIQSQQQQQLPPPPNECDDPSPCILSKIETDTNIQVPTVCDEEILSTQKDEVLPETTEVIGPLQMIRKSAVAAVGGTMVGVGLVMIPLPTPFGAVIASSGLAVLGTEFKEAKELNDKLIQGATTTVKGARDRIVKSIESMEIDEFDADKDQGPRQETAIQATTTAVDGKKTETTDGSSTSQDSQDGVIVEDSPKWLHMNPIERERQERLAREKYRRENQSVYGQTKEYFTKKTGSFLSRTLLPLLKENKVDEKETILEEGQDKGCNHQAEEEGYVLVGTEDDDDVAPQQQQDDIYTPNQTN